VEETLPFSTTTISTSEIEIATQEVGTRFNNRSLLYRAVFDQQSKGRLAGSFGVSGLSRDFQGDRR
jgi:hypothetical protein